MVLTRMKMKMMMMMMPSKNHADDINNDKKKMTVDSYKKRENLYSLSDAHFGKLHSRVSVVFTEVTGTHL